MSLFAGTELYRAPTCEICGQLETDCVCPPPTVQVSPASEQTATLRLEKRKRGKQVTLVQGLAAGHPGHHFGELLTQIKNHCGAGGAIKQDVLEIQGNQLEKIRSFLKQQGFRVK